MNSETILYSSLAVGGVSLISLIGIFTLSLKRGFLERITLFLVSLAAGALIGDVFFHILPEVVEEKGFDTNISLMILTGLLSFFILEKVIHWRHCHKPTSEKHPHPLAFSNLIGDGIHNFIDGLIIGASFLSSPEIGIATTLAVLLHEIPQEIGDFGILVYAGIKKSNALLFNFFSALLAFVGAYLALALGERSEELALGLLAFAAGSFIYIAVADLFPELKHESKIEKSTLQLLMILLGLGLMFLLTYAE